MTSNTHASSVPPPVASPEEAQRSPEHGVALCLSGGGYRAMLFHVGVLWRLCDSTILQHLKRISSVSGGSITAAVLGLEWTQLASKQFSVPAFCDLVVRPIRQLAARTIDTRSVSLGLLNPFSSVSQVVASYYDKYLFSGATLQDLPDDASGPRFVINATSVQTGALWRFSRPYMGDWKVGRWKNYPLPLATAVAASSAFPPVLSPCIIEIDREPDFAGDDPETRADSRYRSQIELTDGGVFDNLGLETCFKRYTAILVSDAGAATPCEPNPDDNWAGHAKRILDIVDLQVRNLRKRQVIQALSETVGPDKRDGAFWSSRSNIASYNVGDPYGYLAPASLGLPWRDTVALSRTPTRLQSMESWRQEALVNWGYAITDAALRAHFQVAANHTYGIKFRPASSTLPYPEPR